MKGRVSHAGKVRPVRGVSCNPSQASQLKELHRFHRVRDFKTLFKFAELGFYHPVCGDIMPIFV
jgi:hypothetical protein